MKYTIYAMYRDNHHIEGHYVTTIDGVTALALHGLEVDHRITEMVITNSETNEVLKTIVRA